MQCAPYFAAKSRQRPNSPATCVAPLTAAKLVHPFRRKWDERPDALTVNRDTRSGLLVEIPAIAFHPTPDAFDGANFNLTCLSLSSISAIFLW